MEGLGGRAALIPKGDSVTNKTHHPPNPYNRCIRVKPKNLNAESPSKNWDSGIAPLAASRLNHPLEAISSVLGVFDVYK